LNYIYQINQKMQIDTKAKFISPFCVSWSTISNSSFSREYKSMLNAEKEAKRLAKIDRMLTVEIVDANINTVKKLK